jgi:hypothetical protein
MQLVVAQQQAAAAGLDLAPPLHLGPERDPAKAAEVSQGTCAWGDAEAQPQQAVPSQPRLGLCVLQVA